MSFIIYKRELSRKVLAILAVGVYLIANEFTIILNYGYELNGLGQKLIKVASAVFVNGRIFTIRHFTNQYKTKYAHSQTCQKASLLQAFRSNFSTYTYSNKN